MLTSNFNQTSSAVPASYSPLPSIIIIYHGARLTVMTKENEMNNFEIQLNLLKKHLFIFMNIYSDFI